LIRSALAALLGLSQESAADMATPSLKRMEGGTQEGIYASSDASYVGEVDKTDLGLTLLPGSQIQTECDKEGNVRSDRVHHEWGSLRKLINGSNKGIASKTGRSALNGRTHQDVCLQDETRDPVEIEPEGNSVSKRHETTCVRSSSCLKAAERSGDAPRTEPHKAIVVSKEPARSRSRDWNDLIDRVTFAYPENVRVSETSSPAVRGVDESRVREPVHGLHRSIEGESVVLNDEARFSESDAEDSLDGLRPHKRQKTGKYLPCSLFQDLQDAIVEQLDVGVDLWRRGVSDNDFGGLSTEAGGVLRSRSHSRSHNPVNNVRRVVRGTVSEPHYSSPRPTSTRALETRSRSLSTRGSSSNSSGHTIRRSARPERSDTPLATPPHTSRAITTPALSSKNRVMSHQPHEQPNFRAPSASTASLSDTPRMGDSFTRHSQAKSALNEGSSLLETLPSATALPLHDLQERDEFAKHSVPIDPLSALPTHLTNSAEAPLTVSMSTISSAQSPFTERLDKCDNNSIHDNTSLDITADNSISPGDDLQLEAALPYRIGPISSQEAYESPYAPGSRRLQHLLRSQIGQTDNRDPMEHLTLEPAITATASTPPISQHHHPATLNPSNASSPTPLSHPRPGVQSESLLSMPPPPRAPSQSSVSRTGPPNGATSEQDLAESDGSSSESSSEESSAPTETIFVPPTLVNAAKKGLHAITSVFVNRVHHPDIVPRVISFIKTFPPYGEPFAPSNGSSAGPGDACPADQMDLLYKTHCLSKRNLDLSLRNTVLKKERDRFKRAAREWATMDPESGFTKGQSMSREVRSLRSQLVNKTVEAERLRKAWFEFEASRSASNQFNYTHNTGAFSSGHEKRSFPTAEPTPPTSKRVSIDLTEGTPEPSSTLATAQPVPPRPLSSSPAAADLRSTMKRKAYSWLPDKSNHMVKKPSVASRGSRPSTAIELDVEGPVVDADAELEAELERELLASQHAEEREQQQQQKRQRQQAAREKRQKLIKASKDRRAKAATTAVRAGWVEEERERLVVPEKQQLQQQQKVVDEQRLRNVEERARAEGLFGVEDDQQRTEAEDRARDEELFGMDEEESEEIVDVQVGPKDGWDEAAELALRRALNESCEESEEE